MSFDFSSQRINSCLIFGGSGFLGSHVVEHLLQEIAPDNITVASRNPRIENQFKGVTYTKVDIRSKDSVKELINNVEPEVIFHMAAPQAADTSLSDQEHFDTIVGGASYIVEAAKASTFVKALIYTSTCAVYTGYVHFDTIEDASLWTESSDGFAYYRAKAKTDQMILDSNTRPKDPRDYIGSLLTGSIRLPMCYGERDSQNIPAQLDILQKKQHKIQLGDGENCVNPAYSSVVAEAEILLAKALLATGDGNYPHPDEKVDGEGFNVHNDYSEPFWSFSHRIWKLVGHDIRPQEITKIPAWLALGVCQLIAIAYYGFSFGTRGPPLNKSHVYVGYSIRNATYSIQKARDRLGFDPRVDLEPSLRSSITSTLTTEPRFSEFKLINSDSEE